MNRRGFLAGILASGFAPAAIGSGVLMPVRRLAFPSYHGVLPFNIVCDGNSIDYLVQDPWTNGRPRSIRGVVLQGDYTVRIDARGRVEGFGLTRKRLS